MHRHLSSLSHVKAVTHALVNDVSNGESTPDETSLFSILWENEVGILKGSSCSNCDSRLSETCHVEGYLSLSLTHVEDGIHFLNSYHEFPNSGQQTGLYVVKLASSNIAYELWNTEGTLQIHNSEYLQRRKGMSVLHLTGVVGKNLAKGYILFGKM